VSGLSYFKGSGQGEKTHLAELWASSAWADASVVENAGTAADIARGTKLGALTTFWTEKDGTALRVVGELQGKVWPVVRTRDGGRSVISARRHAREGRARAGERTSAC
jgi:hypothetical protein